MPTLRGQAVTRAMVDAATVLMVGVGAGGAGWWAHAVVEERRMRRLLARIHATMSERH